MCKILCDSYIYTKKYNNLFHGAFDLNLTDLELSWNNKILFSKLNFDFKVKKTTNQRNY